MKLLTPGPVHTPEFVTQAISQPVMQHRSTEFEAFYGKLLTDLRYLFQTKAAVCGMIGSGTTGVEAAMYSLFRPQEKVLIVDMGKFSGRWGEYAKILDLNPIILQKEWGESVEVEEVIQLIQQHPDITGIILTHCETSTAASIDLEEIVFAIKEEKPEICVLVDAISSVGVIPFYFDDWQIDCAVVASQKSLMNPAGTVFFALSPLAQLRLKVSNSSDILNLFNYLRYAQDNSFPYSPPTQLFYGVAAALQSIRYQSLPIIWNRTHQLSKHFKSGLQVIGGELFGQSKAASLTAFSFPNQNQELIRAKLAEEGLFLSGGQGKLKGKIMRIAHFGDLNSNDMQQCLEALIRLAT